jgi:peptide/nickel transport system permease protein
MPPFLVHLIRRLFTFFLILFITTAVLYATVMLTPAETRAELYMPPNARQTEKQRADMIQRIIKTYHLNDPYPIQYYYYASNIIKGNWGFSPTMNEGVFEAITVRTPVTAELTFYSILAFIPLGLLSGVIAGSKQHKAADHSFRFVAYIATSLPPFILALILMAFFYVSLYWFGPERTSTAIGVVLTSPEFQHYTGFVTIDGLLNGRLDVTLDAFRHLVMPVFTLAFAHWATLGRVTRATMIEESKQEYVVAARARGIRERTITRRHILRNAIAPALTSSILSAAALLTGVYVVEIIFNFHGVSEVAIASMQYTPDAPAALGFTIYSVIVVLALMFILDILQVIINPRLREGQDS